MTNPSSTYHVAPGPAAGYFFQVERILYWLATCPSESKVGIETEDDVVTKLRNGETIREQDKHSTTKNIPFGNRSYDLWNTLYIWTSAIKRQDIKSDSTRFFMVTNKILDPRSLAQQISSAEKEEEIIKCYEALEKEWQKLPPENSKLRPKMIAISKCKKSSLLSLIKNITCLDATTRTSGNELRKEVLSALHVPSTSNGEAIFESLIGWIFNTVLELWRNNRDAWISRIDFDNRYQIICDLIRRKRLRFSPANEILINKGEREVHTKRLFFKQLEIISVDLEIAYEAIDDFIRLNREKLRTAQSGDLSKEEWDPFYDELITKWKSIFRYEKEDINTSPESIGRKIYHKTLSQQALLAGVAPESYIISGSYQSLSDNLLVGWHPDYKVRLKRYKKGGFE